MSLTADSTELGMMLPMRGGLSIAEYYESLIYEFGDGLFDGIPTMLCGEHRGDAVIFSADVTDSGAHFYFEGCEAEKLIFRPKGLGPQEDYKKSLIFIEQDDFVYMFFSGLNYVFQERFYFDLPRLLYRRASRGAKRVRLSGIITLRKVGGVEVVGELHDFSPTGASFFVASGALQAGENILAEFTIQDCGTCETVVNVVRTQTEGMPHGQCLVGIKMSLTKDQKRRAEHLYLCKKAEEIKQLPEYARNTRMLR